MRLDKFLCDTAGLTRTEAKNAVKKQTYVRTVGTPMVPAKEGEKAE